MPQHDYNILNAPGASVRADMNGAFSATQSQNSGASEPTATIAYMIWIDTTTGTHKQRNSGDSGWIILHKIASKIIQKDDIGANKASAPTVDLATATGKTLTVTGNTGPITSFGNVEAGFNFTVIFSSNPVISHNVTSLILPANGADIQARPGDVMKLVSLGSSNWKATSFTRADGKAIAPFRGALVHLSLDQSIINGNNVEVLWDSEVYNTDNIHSTVTNPERLTVPPGVTRIILKGNIRWEVNATGSRRVEMGGASAVGKGSSNLAPTSGGTSLQNVCSGVMSVTGGQQFTLSILQTSGGNLDIVAAADTWFSMEIIE